jgi:hypothetical protein
MKSLCFSEPFSISSRGFFAPVSISVAHVVAGFISVELACNNLGVIFILFSNSLTNPTQPDGDVLSTLQPVFV